MLKSVIMLVDLSIFVCVYICLYRHVDTCVLWGRSMYACVCVFGDQKSGAIPLCFLKQSLIDLEFANWVRVVCQWDPGITLSLPPWGYKYRPSYLSVLLVWSGDWPQVLTLPRQVLYLLSYHSRSPFLVLIP